MLTKECAMVPMYDRRKPRTAKGHAAREIIATMGPEHSLEWFVRQMDARGLRVNESYFTELYAQVHGFGYSTIEERRRERFAGQEVAKVEVDLGPEPIDRLLDMVGKVGPQSASRVEAASALCRLAMAVEGVGGVARARVLLDGLDSMYRGLGA
ncbi:MAG: hypothetical protein KGL39_20640 [Patescibacteria group bacterium]|nr:hypothetical protein [Patescibacteria group bacterium]